MLQDGYFLAKIGADTAENEQHFAEICQKLATTLRVRSSTGALPPGEDRKLADERVVVVELRDEGRADLQGPVRVGGDGVVDRVGYDPCVGVLERAVGRVVANH